MNAIRNLARTASIVTLIFGAVLSAQGQTQPQPQTQPGRPNNFAGGKPSVGGVNPNAWFNNPAVRQYLQINNEQQQHLSKAYQDAWTNYQKSLNGIDANDAQRQQRLQQSQQKFYKDFSIAPYNYLKNPGQFQRYEGLYWQHRGYGAFSDPSVVTQLKLTPAQRTKLGQYQQEWTAQMEKLDPMYRSNREQAVQGYTKLQSQFADRVNSVLTPEQQTAWRQMTGQPYTFGPDVYFGPTNNNPTPKQ